MSLVPMSGNTQMLLCAFLHALSPAFAEEIYLASTSNARAISPAALQAVRFTLIPLSSQLLKYQTLMSPDVLIRLRVAIAPHKRIPPEILLKIFGYLRSEDEEKGLRGFKIPGNSRPSCILLRQICRRWREVVIDCHPLWNSVLLSTDIPSTPRILSADAIRKVWEARVSFVQAIIARKGPIDISINVAPSHEPSLLPYAVNRLVKPLASRISTLLLTAPFISCLDFLQMDGSQFTSLEHLELNSRHAPADIQRISTLGNRASQANLVRHAPGLSCVSLAEWNIMLRVMPPSFVKWAELISLNLYRPLEAGAEVPSGEGRYTHMITYKELLPFLVQAVNLTIFVIAPGRGPLSESLRGEQVVLPNLELFAVEVVHYEDWDCLQSVTAGPSLELLSLRCFHYDGVEAVPFPLIASFVERSSCGKSLDTLCVSPPRHTLNPFYELDSRFLEDIGELLPNLSILGVPMVFGEEELSWFSEGSLLCNLHTLSCRVSGHPIDIIDSLAMRFSAVMAASSGCQQLQNVYCFDNEAYEYSLEIQTMTANISSQYGIDLGLYPRNFASEIHL